MKIKNFKHKQEKITLKLLICKTKVLHTWGGGEFKKQKIKNNLLFI